MTINKKNILISWFIFFGINFISLPSQSQEVLNKEQNNLIDSEKTLRVVTNHFPPLVIIDEEEYTGFSIDFWDAIASELGINYTIENTTFVQIIHV